MYSLGIAGILSAIEDGLVLEWIKIKRVCPYCKRKLRQSDII